MRLPEWPVCSCRRTLQGLCRGFIKGQLIITRKDEPTMQSLVQVILRAILQQPQLHLRMQKQRRVHHQQEKSHSLQSLPPQKVPHGGHVQERLPIRQKIQLVQNPLPPPRTTTAAQQQQQANMNNAQQGLRPPQKTPPLHQPHLGMGLLGMSAFPPPLLHLPKTKEELMLLGLDEYKHSASPSVSSPESHNSDSSVEVSDARRLPLFPGLLPHTFLPPPGFLFPPGYTPLYPGLLQPANNNNRFIRNHNHGVEAFNKRIILDAVLQSQRTPTPEEVDIPVPTVSPIQEDPIDLSMKTNSDRGSSPSHSDHSGSIGTERGHGSEADEESDCDSESQQKRMKLLRPTPLDLTTKV
ncbi:hypothetical protein JTB14_021395 [Gonioctena quinquepunctata]|nr:hypothetical protein JTB14_021395 [Gonioctena quinquepunctata]